MKKIVINLLLMVALICTLGVNAYAATVNVSIGDNFFSPQTVNINVGDTVIWTNNGFAPHTATSGTSCPSGNGTWDSGVLSHGQTFSFTFTQAGTFPYFCTIHCFTGTVIVNPVQVPTAPAPSGTQFFVYAPVVTPVVNTDLTLAKPLAIGPLAEGGDLLSLQVALSKFQVPVDIYVVFYAPMLDPNAIYNVSSSLFFQGISLDQFLQSASAGLPPTGMTPWMSGVIEPVNATLFADVPVSALPPGAYSFFVLVTLPNDLFNFDLFETDFAIGVPITATLSGTQEVPPVNTTATATAILGADFTSGAITGAMVFSGLSSNATAAHIHDAPAGSNGPIILPFAGGVSATSGTWSISGVLTPSQLNDLSAGLLYVNIHSENFPSGEIRAQLILP